MQLDIRSSFVRDAKKLPDSVREDIANAIALISDAKSFSNIPDVKDLKGGKKARNAYRMLINSYRICFYYKDGVIELVRVLPRKNVYKVFP
jgi:mRNA interferase RelE/StbE